MTTNENFHTQTLNDVVGNPASERPMNNSPMEPFSVNVPVNSKRGLEIFVPGPLSRCQADEVDVLAQVVRAMEKSGQGGVICDALHVPEDGSLTVRCIAIYADSRKFDQYTQDVWAKVTKFVDKRMANNTRTFLVIPATYNGYGVKDIDLSKLPEFATTATAINIAIENGVYISYMHRPPFVI